MKYLFMIQHINWFINLNNIAIPREVQLLQLGEGFGLPINKYNIDKIMIEFHKEWRIIYLVLVTL